MKKRHMVIIIICAVIVLAVIAFLIIQTIIKRQMAKIPDMSAADCLTYTLQGKADAVITVGVIQNGEATWKVYGQDGRELPDTLYPYEIGSLTKTMTATMIAQAVEEGKINLSDPLDKYLKLPHDKNYPTIQDILTHTSGFPSFYYESPMTGNFFAGRNSFYGVTDEMMLNRLGKWKQKKEDNPWKYSNFGYAALGLVLENVYSEEYAVLADNFLKEHQMTNSHISSGRGELPNGWDWNRDDSYLSAGAVVSDIEDMLRYASYQLDDQGIFADTHKVLKEVNATTDNYALFDMHADAMGMAWIHDEKNGFIWHNGGTSDYNSYLGFAPETKTAVVVLSNLSPNYRIPASVYGIKLLKELQ